MPRTPMPALPQHRAAGTAAPAAGDRTSDAVPTRGDFLALFSAVMLPMFLAAVDQTLLATATPHIAADLGGLSDTSWIAVGYLLSATVMAPIYGRLGDRYGRRNLLLVALAVFAAGSLACGVAGSLGMLIAARVLQGLGGGGLMVLSQSLIGELVAPRYRPRYQGYFAVLFTVSSVGGPVIGGLVVSYASWRWLLLANLPLCALALWRVAKLPLPERSPMRDAPFDPWGVVLFIFAGSSALLWFSLAGHRFHWWSMTSAALLAFSVVCWVVLLRQQRRHPFGFLPLDILRLPGVAAVCISVFCFAGTMFALVFLLPIYLQLGHGADAASAGLQLMPLTAGLVIGSTLNARWTTRSGVAGTLPRYGLGAAAIALLVLAVTPPSLWTIGIASAVCGIGFGTVMPTAQLLTQMLAGRERLGAAAALLSLTRSSGAAFGTAAFSGLVFALLQVGPGAAGETPQLELAGLTPQALTHAFHIAFAALAAFVALGAWAAFRAPAVSIADDALPEPAA
jgi:MFS family permease